MLFFKSQKSCSLEGQQTLFAFTEHVKIVAAHFQFHGAAVLGLKNNKIPHTDGTVAAELCIPAPVRKGRKILPFRIDFRFLRHPRGVIVFIPNVQAAQQGKENCAYGRWKKGRLQSDSEESLSFNPNWQHWLQDSKGYL